MVCCFPFVPNIYSMRTINQNVSESCSICLDGIDLSLTEGPKAGTGVSCGHFFHTSCINQWVYDQGRNSCPNCRQEITRVFLNRQIVPVVNNALVRDNAGNGADNIQRDFSFLRGNHRDGLGLANAQQYRLAF